MSALCNKNKRLSSISCTCNSRNLLTSNFNELTVHIIYEIALINCRNADDKRYFYVIKRYRVRIRSPPQCCLLLNRGKRQEDNIGDQSE